MKFSFCRDREYRTVYNFAPGYIGNDLYDFCYSNMFYLWNYFIFYSKIYRVWRRSLYLCKDTNIYLTDIGSALCVVIQNIMWIPAMLFSCVFALTHFCPPFQHLLSERLTSVGIMGAPRVPPLNPSETIVFWEHYRLWGV